MANGEVPGLSDIPIDDPAAQPSVRGLIPFIFRDNRRHLINRDQPPRMDFTENRRLRVLVVVLNCVVILVVPVFVLGVLVLPAVPVVVLAVLIVPVAVVPVVVVVVLVVPVVVTATGRWLVAIARYLSGFLVELLDVLLRVQLDNFCLTVRYKGDENAWLSLRRYF